MSIEVVMPKAKAWPKEIVVYTDGASRGNPGPASIGVYITDVDGELVYEWSEAIGHQTNNFAEYTALIRGFEIAQKKKCSAVTVRADSELMIRQMLGVYKVKSEVIIPLHTAAKELAKSFRLVRYEHVRREQNTEADRLANEALDHQ